jgi:long-chain acyl-CoA synthetase
VSAPATEWLLGDTLLRAASSRAAHPALVADDVSYDYATLLDSSLRLAHALQENGLTRGGRVVIQTANQWHCAIAVYATALADGVFVVLHPQTKRDKLRFVLEDCGAEALIAGKVALAALQDEALPPDLGFVLSSGAEGDVDWIDASLEEAIEGAEPTPRTQAIPQDLAALIYNSGSTGTPKGVMMRHRNVVFTLQSLCRYLRLDEDERILNFLPLSFDYGLYQLLMAVRMGATLVVEPSFVFPWEVVKRAQAEEVTVFPGVPTAYATLRGLARERPDLQLPSVRKVTNTAAALPPAILDDLRRIFPNALIFAMYGLTECKRVSYLEPELLAERPSSVGKAIPGTETMVLVDGRPAEPGEEGVLHVRGPHVMAGYWNRPDLTDEMLVPGPVEGERMLCTHDFFTRDEDGFLYFVGRSDDIIKSGGQKVSPAEVETALQAIPEVSAAVVVGVEDEVLGQRIRAHVVLFPDATLTERDVIRACRERLEPTMVPHEVVFADSLPTTDSGKVTRRGLS